MCGIVGYVGPREATPVLVEGLSRLEYRGYDSAGVAVLNGGVQTRKLAGRITRLRGLLAEAPVHGSCGIGHPRRATRGSPVLLGVGDGEFLVASDASAVLAHTRSVVYLNDGDVAVVTRAGYRVLDRHAREQDRAVDDIEWDLDAIALGGYPHFMLKEI